MILETGHYPALGAYRPPPARRLQPSLPVAPSQDPRRDGAPRYAPYGPDRPSGRGARAAQAYQSVAQAGSPPQATLAGLDCYA